MSRLSAPVALAALVAIGSLPATAAAQDDDWGITRERGAGGGGGRVRGGGGRVRGGGRGRVRGGGRGAAANPTTPDRTAVLIERYLRVLQSDPRESFAFQRLLDLYRERDGSVDRLLEELRTRAAADPGAFAPRMLLGHLHRARNELDQALVRYQQAAAIRPEDPAPLAAMARLRRPTAPAEARTLLERALEHTRAAPDREALVRELGEVALEMSDLDGARGYFDRLAREGGQSVFLRTELARALAARGDHRAAVAEYQRVLRALSGDTRVIGPVLRDLAQSQLDAGDANDAIATLDRALRVAEPGVRREVRDVLVDAYRRSDRLPELAERLGREGGDFDAQVMLARVHEELGNDDEALAAYRRALSRNPREIDARVGVIQLLSRSGRMEEVVAEYRAVIRVAPREPRFVVELAQLLMQTGRREEALRLAAETARRFGGDSSVHTALADLYSRWGEEALAVREIETLTRIDPRDPGHLEALGAQQLAAGQRDAALATWRRILQADSDRARAHATLGAIYADHDLLADAETAYREATRLEPDRMEYVRGHANVLERLRRDDEAVRQWTRVLELTADDRAARREARQRIVAIWARGQQLGRRAGELERRFRAQPPDAESGRFLAEVYRAMRNRGEDARRVLADVIALEPGDVESLLALERAYASAGDLSAAIATLGRLVEADARRAPQYLQRMAEHSLALYRDEDAVRYAERAVEHTPDDAEAHRRLGDLYRARQDGERAIASYRRAITLDERMFATHLELAELHLARGEQTDADRLFRRVVRGSPDDDLVGRAARASIQIHLGAGTLEELEQELLPLAIGHTQRPIYRRAVVELYDALTGPLIHVAAHGGPGASAAEDRLRRLGGRAIKPLLDALADSDPAQRRVAVSILGHLQNPNAAAPLLAAATGEGDFELRERALIAAAAVATPDLAPRFAQIVRDRETRLRPAAMLALARLGGAGGGGRAGAREAVAALRDALGHGDPTVRALAAIGVGHARDAQSIPALSRILRDDLSSEPRAAAAWALGRFGDAEGDRETALISALRGDRAEMPPFVGLLSRAAADSLGRAGADRGRDALAELLFDADPRRREAAALGLRLSFARRAERPAPPPLPPPPASTSARRGAAAYLDLLLAQGAPDPATPIDLAPLRPTLERAAGGALGGDGDRVHGALAVLGARIDAPAAGTGVARPVLALGPLTAHLEAWPEAARADAERELAELGAAIVPSLVAVLPHADPTIRATAIRILGAIHEPAAAAAVLGALDDQDEVVRRAGLLAVVPGPGAVDRVGHILATERDWSLRTRAAEALGRLGPTAAVPLARALREDDYAFVREAAARALHRLDTPEARAALQHAATGDPEPRVRAAAALENSGR